MESTLYADEHVEVRVIPSRRVVVVRRTATQGEATSVLASFARALGSTPRNTHRGYGLVLDTRDAVGRSDPDFERGTEALRRDLDDTFSRVVLLVRTQAGSLQAQRMAREAQRQALVSFDYEEALTLAAPR